jgi:hypothetical protein
MRKIPPKAEDIILKDAVSRDTVTARRKRLVEILSHERYLTRAGLIARVEAKLGKGCFGELAWKDVFYRDMRVVKKAFQAAGYQLVYSRSREKSGYYLREQDRVSSTLRKIIRGAVAEVDTAQVAVTRQLEPTERVQQGFSISTLANQVVAYRQNQRGAAHA